MKTYLSFGGGVNSVAMMLLMLDKGWDFEAVFVDHGCDWPETYQFLEMFQDWLKDNGHKQIAVIKPAHYRKNIRGKKVDKIYTSIYDLAYDCEIIPGRINRWCTKHFKIDPLRKYMTLPAFNCLGFDTDEAYRATLHQRNGEELRYPLLEYEMTRDDCHRYIAGHGLPIPIKSGCWFCPFQRISQFRQLRIYHPDLWCKAKVLEQRSVEWRIRNGREPLYLKDKPLDIIVNEAQGELFEEYKPPCYCGR